MRSAGLLSGFESSPVFDDEPQQSIDLFLRRGRIHARQLEPLLPPHARVSDDREPAVEQTLSQSAIQRGPVDLGAGGTIAKYDTTVFRLDEQLQRGAALNKPGSMSSQFNRSVDPLPELFSPPKLKGKP